MGNPNTETKRTKNTQTLKTFEIGLHFRKLKSRKVKRKKKEIHCPPGGKKE